MRAYSLTLYVTYKVICYLCLTPTSYKLANPTGSNTTQQGEVQHRSNVVNPLVHVIIRALVQYQFKILELGIFVRIWRDDCTVGVDSLYHLVSHLKTLINR
ncbi:hypothetical protein D3C85_1411590 [compost metagenome]